jgi:hypothetical protein
MSLIFTQKLRLAVSLATLLLISLAGGYLYTHSKTKQAQKQLTTQENFDLPQQHITFVSSSDKAAAVQPASSYPVIDEMQNYKFRVNSSDLFSSGQLPSVKVDFNQSDLLTVLSNTRKYFQDYAHQDPLVLRSGVLESQGVSVQDVLKTLDFMIAVLQEDIAHGRTTRLKDPNFITTHFRVIKWSPYNPHRSNQTKLRITKYAVFTHPGSHTRTATFNTPIYSLKSNFSQNKFYTRYTKKDVLSGIYESGGKEQGKVETLAYLTRNGLEEALMEGTILVDFVDGSKAFFNVDRNNEMSYIRGVPAAEQKRYWYFKQVDAIKGYGYKIDAKISILPKVTFAGDVLNIGLGKVIVTEYIQGGEKHLHLGVIADTGGAFLPNLHQLDYLAGIFRNQQDFEEHSRVLPDYVTAYILVKK